MIHRLNGLVAATLLTTTALSSGALAHHPGGIANSGSGGPINTISATTLEQGHGAVGVSVIYSDFDQLSDETLIEAHEAGIEHVHDLGSIGSYGVGYVHGVTNDLMLGFRLPYVKHTGIRAVHHHHEEAGGAEEEPEVENHGDTEGIGDLSLYGQYRFYRSTNTDAAVILGLKTPTGETGERTRDGEIQDAEFQPGSGSWDPLFGLALTHRVGAWSFDANVLYNLVTEGTQDTDLGDQFLYNLAVSYRLTGYGSSGPMFHGAHEHEAGDDGHGHHHEASGPALDLVLELNGEVHQKQETAGISDGNSGGHTLYLSPGLRLSQGNWSGYASVGIPIVKDENGIQPEPEWRLTSGVSVGF